MANDRGSLVRRLGEALGTAIVPVQGKRPMLLDRVFRSALERLGFNNPDDRIPEIRERIAERFLEEVGPLLTEAEIARLRTLVEYGLTHSEAGALFSLSEEQVRQIVEGRALVRVKR